MGFVLKTQVDALMTKISQCRSRWGTSTNETFNPTAGSTVCDERDMNKLRSWVEDVNNRSGARKPLPASVNEGDLLRNILDTLTTTAEQIRTHCPCNCNHCSCDCDNCTCQGRGCGDGNNN